MKQDPIEPRAAAATPSQEPATPAVPVTAGSHAAPPGGRDLTLLALAALGIVFGDIGTSPLYALRESFHGSYGIAATRPNVLGILSLIFWSLILVISIKYLIFVLRADNRGEGGVIALTALVTPLSEKGRRGILVLVGLFGASLLYGDSMITPAISVLSAIEGLEIATPFFEPYVIPITLLILVALFTIQRHGTAGIGAIFGPVMLLWFFTLAALGIAEIMRHPAVLTAVNPVHAVDYFARNGMRGFWVLGSVFLCVTGGEALYADIGHFGRFPIRITWFTIVLPALTLNYFGQGALIINNPGAIEQPFFLLAPGWALYPLVALATAATVIASQAVISGAFSLTRQAVQLGYLPRLDIEHTSTSQIGQIYVAAVNRILMVACLALVIGFGSSSALAAAYGVAVTTDMVFTTILFAVVAYSVWRWNAFIIIPLAAVFLFVDLAFWGANIIKVPHGGWFPLLVAAGVFTLMTTWKRGRQILGERLRAGILPIELFLNDIRAKAPLRVPGTAIFMVGNPNGTPPALLHNLKHNKVLHERVVFLNVVTRDVPHVPAADRVTVKDLGEGMYRVTAAYGFTEDPDVPAVLERCGIEGLKFKMMETSFFLGRETLIASKRRRGMAIWRERLFAVMARNSQRATAFFRIPPNRVVELGAQIEL